MDIFFEILVEVYLSVFEILVPEKKFKKWQETLLKLLCILVCLVVLGCLAAGIALLVEGLEHLRVTGIALVCVGSVLLALQIALVITVIVNDVKKQKAEKAEEDEK